MAPVRFDDIAKTAKDVLGNDYQESGYSFKAKQKTSWNGAVATTAVDLLPGKDCFTPAKVTWKIPKPYGIMGFSIDKLEMDKAGKYKLESSMDKDFHRVPGLKLDVKSDLLSKDKITAACTYTGVPDTQVIFDTNVMKPETFVFEATHNMQKATVGVKCGMANLTAPDLGMRFVTGGIFTSLLVTKKFSLFTAHCAYKAPGLPVSVAATCVKSDKSLEGSAGVEYKPTCCTTVKAKVTNGESCSVSVKQDVTKGFTVTAGGKMELASKNFSYGVSLSVE